MLAYEYKSNDVYILLFTHFIQSLYLASVHIKEKHISAARNRATHTCAVPRIEITSLWLSYSFSFLQQTTYIYIYISRLQKMYLINTILREFDVYLPNKYKSHFLSTCADIIFESN